MSDIAEMQDLLAKVPASDGPVLQWDGFAWTTLGNHVGRDVWNEGDRQPDQIGPGWTVWSRLQVHHGEAPDWQAREMYGGRNGICLEVYRRAVYRLIVPHDDVFQARPATRAAISDARSHCFASLGPQGRNLRRVKAEWVENAAMLLGAQL